MRDADDPKAARYVRCWCGHFAMLHDGDGRCQDTARDGAPCVCKLYAAAVGDVPRQKPRLSLLPWRALLVVARQMAAGLRDGRKPHCWRDDKTVTAIGHVDKALRHLAAYLGGETHDETGQPHLAAAAADLLIAIEVA